VIFIQPLRIAPSDLSVALKLRPNRGEEVLH
jgi:hypothetical protein